MTPISTNSMLTSKAHAAEAWFELPSTPNEDKKSPTVTVQKFDDDQPVPTNETRENSWQPGFINRFPWLGFCAILTAGLCAVAAILVLKLSTKQAATIWCGGVVAPNVLLSIINNVSNLAITVAVGQGVAIAWWRRALSGRTVKDLHYSWSFATSILSIVKKFQLFNVIALAALATKLSIVDSVLFQKSLSTYIDVFSDPTLQAVEMFTSKSFPATGKMGHTDESFQNIEPYFAYDMVHSYASFGSVNRMALPTKCNGQEAHMGCDAYQYSFGIEAAGWLFDCTNTTENIDYGVSAPAAFQRNETAGHTNLTLLDVNFVPDWASESKDYASITFNITFPYVFAEDIGNGVCPSTMTRMSCEMRPAVLNYTVEYYNSTADTRTDHNKGVSTVRFNQEDKERQHYYLDNRNPASPVGSTLGLSCNSTEGYCGYFLEEQQQLLGVRVLEERRYKEFYEPGADSILAGFVHAFQERLSGSTKLTYNGTNWSLVTEGSAPTLTYGASLFDPSTCAYSIDDPVSKIVTLVNQLSFIIANDAWLYYDLDENLNLDLVRGNLYNYAAEDCGNRTVQARAIYKDIFYETDFKYVYGAVAATLICIIGVLPVFWGFWEIGRNVTLSPTEIAHAFQAPAFTGAHGLSGAEDGILKATGKTRVIYGEVKDEHGRKFAFYPVDSSK